MTSNISKPDLEQLVSHNALVGAEDLGEHHVAIHLGQLARLRRVSANQREEQSQRMRLFTFTAAVFYHLQAAATERGNSIKGEIPLTTKFH